MWKLDFFILPSKDYLKISDAEAYEFGEKVNYLDINEKIYVPDDFYLKADINDITAMEFLYGSMQSDLSDYLCEIISKQKICSDTYEEINSRTEYGYLPISVRDITDEIANICIDSVKDVESEKYLKVNDVVKIKRFYINQVKDYKEYENRATECFPHIVFHNDAFECVEKLGRCADVLGELTRHLTILNDVGKKLYDYNGKNEKATLLELKSGYNIECSGKGSNEEASFNKDITYNGKKFQLTCNPHTKLYGKRTNQRIYFCWGRDEIKAHSLIVVRIGDHWKE